MTQRQVSGSDTTTLQWNFDNKPTSITKGGTTVSFTYDGNGQRVKKTSLDLTVLYFGSAYEKRNSVGIIHLFAGNQRVASVDANGITQLYHPDHLGSSWIITDGSGAIKEKNEFHPFGTYHETIDFDSSFPDVNYTFTGQEEDDEVGLYNYNARLYDPVLGRFISPDSIVPDPGDPQALNRYSYCLNNPLIYVDPSGEQIVEWLAYLIGALAMGAFSGAVEAHMNDQNIFAGALIGAAIAGVAFGAGYGVMQGVTALLTPTVLVAGNAGAVGAAAVATTSIGEYIGAIAGAFAGGATAGGLNAAVQGGNIWQGALYGGLASAAFSGFVLWAVELNSLVKGSAGNVSNPDTSMMVAGEGAPGPGALNTNEAASVEKIEKILEITDKVKQGAEDFHQKNHYVEIISREDPGGVKAQQIDAICVPGSGCGRAVDFRATAWKFDNYKLHIRSFPKRIDFHYDRFNIRVNPIKHFWVDMIKNVYYGGFEKGL